MDETLHTPDGSMFPLVLIGVGNSFRSDDGVGIYVSAVLRQLGLQNVDITNEERDGLKLISHWKRGDRVILIDAVSSGAEAGTIHRVDLSNPEFQWPSTNCSTHSFGVMEALHLSRLLAQSPARIVLYGIEGENFEMGTTLSPVVLTAAGRVVELIVEEIGTLRHLEPVSI